MSEPQQLGKLPMEALLSALGGAQSADAEHVLQGPGVGRDAAIIEFAGQALVAAADPITFVDGDAGRLAVTVNANDIFAVGAEPRWLLATVLVPPDSEQRAVVSLLGDLQSACAAAGVALVGGHTEFTDAVARTVISCAMFGTAPLEQIVRSDGAQKGDLIVQAGAAAVEGTALLGHPDLLDAPGVSVASAARALRAVEGVHAMHDVTEGGIATASLELAEAAGLCAELWAYEIVWLEETLVVCDQMGLNPLGLLGSGTLLAAVAEAAADAALSALRATGVEAAVIGRVSGASRATLRQGGRVQDLPRFERDEALRRLTEAAAESSD